VVRRIESDSGVRIAQLDLIGSTEPQTLEVAVTDLVVVVECRDQLYSGLVSIGRVERDGNKPFHTVINAENSLALKTLTYTHRGQIDAIHIDPPDNTRVKDWKYNNPLVIPPPLAEWVLNQERAIQPLMNAN
jgi:adenine-specific DNA-methyltransferase